MRQHPILPGVAGLTGYAAALFLLAALIAWLSLRSPALPLPDRPAPAHRRGPARVPP
jgi:hypothetical protein